MFELYRQTMSDKRYVRILYNGEDVSRRVPFCKKWLEFNVALCAIQDFEDFVGISLLRGVGATSINQFCRS